jgi:hypothetical protein
MNRLKLVFVFLFAGYIVSSCRHKDEPVAKKDEKDDFERRLTLLEQKVDTLIARQVEDAMIKRATGEGFEIHKLRPAEEKGK